MAAQILYYRLCPCPSTFREKNHCSAFSTAEFQNDNENSENRADRNQWDAMTYSGSNKKVENWLAGL